MLRSIAELPLGQEHGFCLGRQSDISFIAVIAFVRIVSIDIITVYIKCKLDRRYIIVVLLFVREIEREVFIIKN